MLILAHTHIQSNDLTMDYNRRARVENFISFPKGQLINFRQGARAPAIVNAPHVHAAEAALCNPLGKHAERDAYPTIFGTAHAHERGLIYCSLATRFLRRLQAVREKQINSLISSKTTRNLILSGADEHLMFFNSLPSSFRV